MKKLLTSSILKSKIADITSFALTGTGFCKSCNSYINHCKSCTNQTYCTLCYSNMFLNSI